MCCLLPPPWCSTDSFPDRKTSWGKRVANTFYRCPCSVPVDLFVGCCFCLDLRGSSSASSSDRSKLLGCFLNLNSKRLGVPCLVLDSMGKGAICLLRSMKKNSTKNCDHSASPMRQRSWNSLKCSFQILHPELQGISREKRGVSAAVAQRWARSRSGPVL